MTAPRHVPLEHLVATIVRGDSTKQARRLATEEIARRLEEASRHAEALEAALAEAEIEANRATTWLEQVRSALAAEVAAHEATVDVAKRLGQRYLAAVDAVMGQEQPRG